MQWKRNEAGIACDLATKSHKLYICSSIDVIQYKRLQVQFSTQHAVQPASPPVSWYMSLIVLVARSLRGSPLSPPNSLL